MTLPGPRDWIFSAKTFVGAMLALWLAMRLDLDRPYWAMATAYIVAQPLAGAMRSKAVYRFLGTLAGAVVSLVLVPVLVDAPELLTAALALWIAVCIYFAILDRTPRSYVFLLAGYTAALIVFPSVDAPATIWDTVLARVEEITLGIVCSTLVGSIVLPRPLGPALARRIDGWLMDSLAWTVAVLTGRSDAPEIRAARRRVAGDAVEIQLLASHLAYDTSHLQAATLPVAILHQRVLQLLPVVSGLESRLGALRAAGGMTPALAALLERMAAWIKGGPAADPAEVTRIEAEIAALEPPIDGSADWQAIMLSGVLGRLTDRIRIFHDIVTLRRHVAAGSSRPPALRFDAIESHVAPRHRDHAMALHSAAAAVLTIFLLAAFWIASAWPEGGGAVALAAVACSFFAAQDDPAPSIVAFLGATVAALVIDGFYLFAVLPYAESFAELTLALAPAYLLFGALIASPKAGRLVGPVAFIGATELSLSSAYSADFAGFVNGSVAAVIGLGATAVVLRVVRSVGAEWTARRLLHANRTDIAHAASDRWPARRTAFASLILDRLSLIVPRLAASAEGADAVALAALADLRVGVNVLDLRRHAPTLPAPARDAVDRLLHGVAAHYRAWPQRPAPPDLLSATDAAIGAVAHHPVAAMRALLLSLAGLRQALFPDGPPYIPDPTAPEPAQ